MLFMDTIYNCHFLQYNHCLVYQRWYWPWKYTVFSVILLNYSIFSFDCWNERKTSRSTNVVYFDQLSRACQTQRWSKKLFVIFRCFSTFGIFSHFEMKKQKTGKMVFFKYNNKRSFQLNSDIFKTTFTFNITVSTIKLVFQTSCPAKMLGSVVTLRALRQID